MKFEEMINTIQLGNCYELIEKIPNKSIDLIIIDPPYEYTTGGVGKNQTGKYKELFERKNKNRSDLKKFTDKGLNEEQARVWGDKEKSREEIKHISSGFDYKLLDILDEKMKNIYIYIWCSKWQVEPLLKHYIDKGCNFEILTWHKSNPLPTMNNTYANDTEYCIMAREKETPLYGNYETKKKYYVTAINQDDKKKFEHPTIKPLNIIKNLIINSSKENDIVLDCFCGSGTTCVACKELNRKFIGMEIDEHYWEIANKRINGIESNGQISLMFNNDGDVLN